VCHVLAIMELQSRRVVHVRRRPSLDWVKQQIHDACYHKPPRFILHDHDGTVGQLGPVGAYRSTLDAWLKDVMGIRGVPIPRGAPDAIE
jgi:hypothetical protein